MLYQLSYLTSWEETKSRSVGLPCQLGSRKPQIKNLS